MVRKGGECVWTKSDAIRNSSKTCNLCRHCRCEGGEEKTRFILTFLFNILQSAYDLDLRLNFLAIKLRSSVSE